MRLYLRELKETADIKVSFVLAIFFSCWLTLGIVLGGCQPRKNARIVPANDNSQSINESEITRVILDVAISDVTKQINLDSVKVCYVELGDGRDASSELLAAVDSPMQLKQFSACKIKGVFSEVIGKKDHKKGILVSLGKIYINTNGTVSSGYCWHLNSMSSRCYDVTLEKTNGKWIVKDIICTLIS